jgi:hypothetical protein
MDPYYCDVSYYMVTEFCLKLVISITIKYIKYIYIHMYLGYIKSVYKYVDYITKY